RSRCCRSRFSRSNAGRRSSLSRLDTTSTTRDASSTWTVVRSYSGAIFTAVCWRLVVAPPMRSGTRMPRRVISFATKTISSSDGLLHGARALDDLRQEHFARAEEIADDLHAVHQRPFDDVERPLVFPARLLDVGVDEVDDAVHERVREPRLDALRAPREVLLL